MSLKKSTKRFEDNIAFFLKDCREVCVAESDIPDEEAVRSLDPAYLAGIVKEIKTINRGKSMLRFLKYAIVVYIVGWMLITLPTL